MAGCHGGHARLELQTDPDQVIYLDHAATSWPKPTEVALAMASFLERAGGNPGRSGHRLSIAAARLVYEAREAVGELLGAADPLRVIFTLNATHGINLALRGLLRPGDRVVTTSMEHNAVMRPLRELERQGVHVTVVPCAPDGTLDPAGVATALTVPARLVVVNHASNVVGAIAPVAQIAPLAHQAGALLLVDAAQTAGLLPTDVEHMGIDLLAFAGHKGMQGPPGVGGLVLRRSLDTAALAPLVRGGTGSYSEWEEQPMDLPDRYESGTPNGVGIAGLGAGVRWLLDRGVEAVRSHETMLTSELLEGLCGIPGVTVYGPRQPERTVAVVSFTMEGRTVSEVSQLLDEQFGILSRPGLHCAPSAHKTIGTFPKGTVRFAPGVFTSPRDIRKAVAAVSRLARP
jgi:cysteine desulfurase/selenocysteine lyase